MIAALYARRRLGMAREVDWTVTTRSADPHVPPLTPLDFTEGRAGEAAETRRRAGVDVQPERSLHPARARGADVGG